MADTPRLTPEWFAGFCDGEANIEIAEHGGKHQPRFRVNQRDDDSALIYAMRDFIGAGSINSRYLEGNYKPTPNSKPQLVYAVAGADCLRVVDVLDKAPLRSKKAHEYPYWRQAVIAYAEKTADRQDVLAHAKKAIYEVRRKLVLPEGNFSCVVADPAWPFKDRLPGGGRGAAKYYDLMSIRDICALPVITRVQKDAILFLWMPNAFIVEAYEVARAWGFEPKTLLTWVKVAKNGQPRMGMGRYLRNCTEQCLVATRGSFKPLRKDTLNVIYSPREHHSAKPECFYDLVRELTAGPRLEMFARHAAPGFTAWGLEAPMEIPA